MTPAEAKSRCCDQFCRQLPGLQPSPPLFINYIQLIWSQQMFSDHSAWRGGWRRWAGGRLRWEVRSLVSTVVGFSRLRLFVWWLRKNHRQTDLFSATSPSSDIFISHSLQLPHVALFLFRLINIYWSNNTGVWTIRIIRVSEWHGCNICLDSAGR